MSPKWNPDDYKNPTVRRFVADLIRLQHEYSPDVSLGSGQTSLMVKAKRLDGSGESTLLEYWPLANKEGRNENHLFDRTEANKQIPVPDELRIAYNTDIERYGKPVTEHSAPLFIRHLRTILEALYGKRSVENPQSKVRPRPRVDIGDDNTGYLPTRLDCENAYRKLAEEGEKLPISDLLDEIQLTVESTGKRLHQQWQSITEKNLAEWFLQEE